MPKPRKTLISLQDTTYYHCVSRCVRRAFLCGQDELTGQSYEHRRGWIEDKILSLAAIFAIDVCAYAVMSNHTHLVLHVNTEKANSWSIREVLERWHRLHKGSQFTEKYLENKEMAEFELVSVYESGEKYRERLTDISWFMRELNEPIARMANNEDKCTGRFWEGRFKSQALLDEAALVSCMAYVFPELKSEPCSRQQGKSTRNLKAYEYQNSNRSCQSESNSTQHSIPLYFFYSFNR